ncbi:hypothetical protein [Gracilimonas tropica]|uniref:hypothetical protein n=1 Tax=Gracilimonas tropica TaxID=454600 RepID=UPI00035FA3F3|nr:hypothetical protein [Gracilimonas tropica]
MEKQIIKIIIWGSLMLLAGCASSKKQNNEGNAVTVNFTTQQFTSESDISNLEEKRGQFNYSGNEPFARPTLFVSGSESYLLIGDENFIENEFQNLNGKKGTVYGKIEAVESQRFFKVYFYKVNEEK